VLQVSTRTVERHVRRAQAQFQLAYERGMQHAVPQRRTTTPACSTRRPPLTSAAKYWHACARYRHRLTNGGGGDGGAVPYAEAWARVDAFVP
jgi:hypothetical protein